MMSWNCAERAEFPLVDELADVLVDELANVLVALVDVALADADALDD